FLFRGYTSVGLVPYLTANRRWAAVRVPSVADFLRCRRLLRRRFFEPRSVLFEFDKEPNRVGHLNRRRNAGLDGRLFCQREHRTEAAWQHLDTVLGTRFLYRFVDYLLGRPIGSPTTYLLLVVRGALALYHDQSAGVS